MKSVEQQLTDTGSLKYGHTTLASGAHASGYLSKEGLLAQPKALYGLAEQLVAKCAGMDYNFVVGPVNFGYQLAAYCALAVDKPCTYVYLPNDGTGYDTAGGRLHRDFVLPENPRALLVDDWAVSGETVAAGVTFMQSRGIAIGGIGLIGANKQAAPALQEQGAQYLLELPFEHIAPADCGPCMVGEPVKYTNIRE